jgi:hypothetical protein
MALSLEPFAVSENTAGYQLWSELEQEFRRRGRIEGNEFALFMTCLWTGLVLHIQQSRLESPECRDFIELENDAVLQLESFLPDLGLTVAYQEGRSIEVKFANVH